MIRFLVQLILMSFIVAGCKISVKKKETADSGSHQHESPGKDISGKWKIDSVLLAHVDQIELVYRTYQSGDPIHLARQLQKHSKQLTADCEMAGSNHDALHEWLVSFSATTTALEKSNSKQATDSLLNQIDSALLYFRQHFE